MKTNASLSTAGKRHEKAAWWGKHQAALTKAIKMLNTNPITTIEVVQFMSRPAIYWMSRIIDREAIQDREFARLLAEAKRKAEIDRAERDAFMVRQHEERAALAMEDVSW